MRTIFDRLAPGEIGVKICGITRAEDARAAINAGATALGYNFFPGSKRFIYVEEERRWLGDIPKTILRVAVVVNPTRDDALRLMDERFLDALQLHGDETPEFAAEISAASGKSVIKAIRVKNADSLKMVAEFHGFAVLLDAFSGAERGGTGHTFDWNSVEKTAETGNLLLSGGLTPENVRSALRLTKLRYVDVASGVELSPRQKSASKMALFVSEVRKSASAQS